MNLHNSLLENKISLRAIRIFSRKDLSFYLIVFFSATSLKIVTELIAYPYPIGYDVINYYIPMLLNIENEWSTLSKEYPFYIYVLHLAQNLTSLSVQTTVSTFATLVFSLFAVSIFSLGKAIFKGSSVSAVLVALFVIVQIPVLRTTWDLHRDMFALTMMFFAISILIYLRNTHPCRFPSLAVILCLLFTVLSVISDRMVGAWLIVVYFIYTILHRERTVALSLVVASVSFIVFLIIFGDGYSIISSSIRSIADADVTAQIVGAEAPLNDGYNRTNLLSYFIALNVLLVPLAIIGYLQIKETLLKISLMVALVGSMTWLVFPSTRELVADRWILLLGVALSIFAGFGFVRTIQLISTRLRNSYSYILVSVAIFLIFAQFGVVYAVLPYEAQVSIIGLFDKNIQSFAPKSMQFNSVKVAQSPQIIDIIKWINENTSEHTTVVGSGDWRGWFISGLVGNRNFVSYERLGNIFRDSTYNPHDQMYLIDTKVSNEPVYHSRNFSFEGAIVYSNSLFTLYRILGFPQNVTLAN